MKVIPTSLLAGLYGFAVLGCLTTSAATATPWPGFRGPKTDGVAEGSRLPLEFGPEKNLRWSVEVPAGHSSPVIAGDLLFLTAASTKEVITLALNRSSGQRRWEQKIEVEQMEKTHRTNSRATSTPVTDGRAVYAYFSSFGLVAYDLGGRELWRQRLPMPKTFRNQGTGTSPLLVDGKLILYVHLAEESFLLATDPASGRELWRTPMPYLENTYSTPITWSEGGRAMLGVAGAKRFTAFHLADGREAWWVKDLGHEACSTPVVVGDRVIISTAGVQGEPANSTPPPPFEEAVKLWSQNGEALVSLDAIPNTVLFTDRKTSDGQGNMSLKSALKYGGGIKDGHKFDRAGWEKAREGVVSFISSPLAMAVVVCVRTGGSGDVTATHVVWRETKGIPEAPSPLVWQNRVYLIRSGSLLACRDLESGRLIYEERLGAPNGFYASPIAAHGRLYFASDRGTVTVVQAGDQPQVLAQNKLAEPIFASPAVADHVLYLRSTKQLWAFAE